MPSALTGKPSAIADQLEPAANQVSASTELLRLHLRHWRSSVLGGVVTYGVLAWAFGAYFLQGNLWWWAALAWINTTAMAALCVWTDRHPIDAEIPQSWIRAMTCSVAAAGLLWGLLLWSIPAQQTDLQIVGAVLVGAAMAGGVSISGSRSILISFSAPIAVLTPAALAWHAGLPVAAIAALFSYLILIQYGWKFQAALVGGIAQHRQTQALLKLLANEQAKRREIEQAQALAAERQRLMREIHDGLGSALSSSLAVAERGKLERNDLAAVLRECLDELRIMVDSLDNASDDLVTLLANLRFRLGRRLETAGIQIAWQMDDLPRLAWMHAEEALHVARIVQELLANVGKHSGASYVSVSAAAMQDQIEVVVSDNGRGFDPRIESLGRGLRSIKQRAESLGGSVHIESRHGKGSTTRLRLPIDGPTATAIDRRRGREQKQ